MNQFSNVYLIKNLKGRVDVVDTHDVVGVTSEEVSAISGPGKGSAVGHLGVLAGGGKLNAEVIDGVLALQVPDLDAAGGGSDEPVAVGGEDEGVDDVVGLEIVKASAFVEVPEHGNTIFATRGAERAVGGDGDSVEVSGVADEVDAELAGGEGPHLDKLVPASRHNHGGSGGGGEADAAHPLGVAILSDGELALANGVPELDGAVARAGHDLTVLHGEGDGEDILGVANEAASALAGGDLPEAEGSVPGAGEGVLAIGGDDDVRDEVIVALESTLGNAVAIALLALEVPDNDGLVTGGSEDHVGVLGGGCDGSDPS